MTNFYFSKRYTVYVYEDILKLYDKFGYNEFLSSDIGDIGLKYTIRKLFNNSAVSKSKRSNDNRIQYKLTPYVVNICKEYKSKHE